MVAVPYTVQMSTNGPAGRGSGGNPPNRFIALNYAPDPDGDPSEQPAPQTRFYRDESRTIFATNDSPDIPFDVSLNPYRGCEHGCSYCYARPTHEYLSFSAGLDFETRIMVKEDAPDLVRKRLSSQKWVPQTVAISGVTDAYQPIERSLKLTRRCLEVFAEFRNPVGVVTKNALVARDVDLFADLARDNAAAVYLSVTTLDADLARRMEPRASAPAARLRAVEHLSAAGVPVGVMFAPVIPGLNDHEAAAVLAAAARAGARAAAFVPLRLPFAVKELFADWLSRHYPERKDKVLGRVGEMRGGRLNESRFGRRMIGQGAWYAAFKQMFKLQCDRLGFGRIPPLSASAFRRPGSLF